jgi:acyl dehydratase
MNAPLRQTTPTYDEVTLGEELPQMVVQLTPTTIVAGAIASRDFYPGHHDKDRARELGMKDIFMNILTSGGWAGRFITDWAGPDALLRNLSIRLGVPNYPGDTMTATGQVIEKVVEAGKPIVRIEIKISNALGDHLTGTAEVELPAARGT